MTNNKLDKLEKEVKLRLGWAIPATMMGEVPIKEIKNPFIKGYATSLQWVLTKIEELKKE